MGQDLEYRCGGVAIEWRISRSDWKVQQCLRLHLPVEVETLFEVRKLGEPVLVRVDQLKLAAERLQMFLADHAEVLPRSFQIKPEKLPPPFVPGWGSGGIGGIRLPNDPNHWYTIHAGLNECRLEQFCLGSDGRGMPKGSRDIRQEKVLETTNMGTILIRSRAAKCELRPMLRKILAFVEGVDGTEIVKTVS